MFVTRQAYDAALIAAYQRGLDAGERTLVVMREQLSTLLKQLEQSLAREGQRAADVAAIAAATAFPARYPELPPRLVTPAARVRDAMQNADPWHELPFGHPSGAFAKPEDAAFIPDLDVDLRRALSEGEETAHG